MSVSVANQSRHLWIHGNDRERIFKSITDNCHNSTSNDIQKIYDISKSLKNFKEYIKSNIRGPLDEDLESLIKYQEDIINNNLNINELTDLNLKILKSDNDSIKNYRCLKDIDINNDIRNNKNINNLLDSAYTVLNNYNINKDNIWDQTLVNKRNMLAASGTTVTVASTILCFLTIIGIPLGIGIGSGGGLLTAGSIAGYNTKINNEKNVIVKKIKTIIDELKDHIIFKKADLETITNRQDDINLLKRELMNNCRNYLNKVNELNIIINRISEIDNETIPININYNNNNDQLQLLIIAQNEYKDRKQEMEYEKIQNNTSMFGNSEETNKRLLNELNNEEGYINIKNNINDLQNQINDLKDTLRNIKQSLNVKKNLKEAKIIERRNKEREVKEFKDRIPSVEVLRQDYIKIKNKIFTQINL